MFTIGTEPGPGFLRVVVTGPAGVHETCAGAVYIAELLRRTSSPRVLIDMMAFAPEFARSVALELLGPERVTLQGRPLTGSEDFAFMLERVPGSYVLIGNDGPDAGLPCMVHNPGYDFNDSNIEIGSAYWVLLAERFLHVQDA